MNAMKVKTGIFKYAGDIRQGYSNQWKQQHHPYNSNPFFHKISINFAMLKQNKFHWWRQRQRFVQAGRKPFCSAPKTATLYTHSHAKQFFT